MGKGASGFKNSGKGQKNKNSSIIILPDSVRGGANTPKRGIGECSPPKTQFLWFFQMERGS